MGVESRAERALPVLLAAVARQRDEEDAHLVLAQAARYLVAADAGQADVQDGDVGAPAADLLEAADAVPRRVDAVSRQLEHLAQGLAHVGLVLDDGDVARSASVAR